MIEKIAMSIATELNFTPSRDFDNLVGIDAHIREMDSLLCLESTEVKMVGIWGPCRYWQDNNCQSFIQPAL